MKLYELFEAVKLAPPANALGAMPTTDQHTPSPLGSGTSKREAKLKPVTMMGMATRGANGTVNPPKIDN